MTITGTSRAGIPITPRFVPKRGYNVARSDKTDSTFVATIEEVVDYLNRGYAVRMWDGKHSSLWLKNHLTVH